MLAWKIGNLIPSECRGVWRARPRTVPRVAHRNARRVHCDEADLSSSSTSQAVDLAAQCRPTASVTADRYDGVSLIEVRRVCPSTRPAWANVLNPDLPSFEVSVALSAACSPTRPTSRPRTPTTAFLLAPFPIPEVQPLPNDQFSSDIRALRLRVFLLCHPDADAARSLPICPGFTGHLRPVVARGCRWACRAKNSTRRA